LREVPGVTAGTPGLPNRTEGKRQESNGSRQNLIDVGVAAGCSDDNVLPGRNAWVSEIPQKITRGLASKILPGNRVLTRLLLHTLRSSSSWL
jgi:hypothetical protein